jgi:hypothetical protein
MARKAEYTEPDTTEAVPGEQPTGESGWETPTTAETGNVITPCRRHTFKGGQTCIRCGAPRPARAVRAPRAASAGGSSESLETVLTLLWGAIGLGIEHQPLIGKEPRTFTLHSINPINDEIIETEVKGAPVSVAVGKALQMEAAVAGRRIDRAWRHGSPLSYALVNLFVNKVTWATDLAPLLVAPMVVALPPAILERVKPMLAQALIPVLVEQAQMMRKQADAMDNLDQFTKDAVENAESMIDVMLGIKQDATRTDNSKSSAA